MQAKIKQFTATEIGKMSPKVGQILAYAGDTIPDGWLTCDHRMLRRRTYPELYSVLRTRYGDGDGSNTAFNLPNKELAGSRIGYIIYAGMADKKS
jgi:microcystin-dependent protein